MAELTKHFQYLIKKNGPPVNAVAITEDFFSAFNGRLPKAFLDFLQQYGLGEWFGGMVKFVDPREFYPTLALWFGSDDAFNHQDCHVVATNAFGDLYIWSERYHSVKIKSSDSQVVASSLINSSEMAEPDIDVYLIFSSNDPTQSFDEFDYADKPLFAECVSRFGPLAADEIYGFKLPIALGGERRIENIQKVKMKEHLMILAQTEPLKLMDYSVFPPRFVREIG